MRHHVPDHQQQQQQQQSFLASLTNQLPVTKSEDSMRIIDKSPVNSTIINKSSLYGVNGSNGQYQQIRQQKTIVKDSVKSSSPVVFPAANTMQQQPSTSIGFPKTSSPGIQSMKNLNLFLVEYLFLFNFIIQNHYFSCLLSNGEQFPENLHENRKYSNITNFNRKFAHNNFHNNHP